MDDGRHTSPPDQRRVRYAGGLAPILAYVVVGAVLLRRRRRIEPG